MAVVNASPTSIVTDRRIYFVNSQLKFLNFRVRKMTIKCKERKTKYETKQNNTTSHMTDLSVYINRSIDRSIDR